MTEADAIVLGAGVAGLTVARALRSEHEHVLCLEAFNHVGGNHRSCDINGYTFDIGSIVFNPEHKLFRYFDGVAETCVPFVSLIQRVAPGGVVRLYPFELKEAMGGSPLGLLANVASLAAGRIGMRKPGNVEEVCIHLLGRRLYEGLGLKTYVERFYGLPADQINMRFAEQRMQFVTRDAKLHKIAGRLASSLGRRLSSKPADKEYPFHAMVRPRSGFETMYGVAQAQLERLGVRFEFGVQHISIRKAGGAFVVKTESGQYLARRVVSTIPVNETLRLIGCEAKAELRSSDLLTLYVSFEGQRNFNAPILYNFDVAGAWKRLTMHSDAYGRVDGREYFGVELPFMKADISGADQLFKDFARHVRASNAFLGDLRLEGRELTPNAYPAYTIGSDSVLAKAMTEIEGFGIETVGRQGRFDYLPTVMHVVDQVERELEAGRLRRDAVVDTGGTDEAGGDQAPGFIRVRPARKSPASGRRQDSEC